MTSRGSFRRHSSPPSGDPRIPTRSTRPARGRLYQVRISTRTARPYPARLLAGFTLEGRQVYAMDQGMHLWKLDPADGEWQRVRMYDAPLAGLPDSTGVTVSLPGSELVVAQSANGQLVAAWPDASFRAADVLGFGASTSDEQRPRMAEVLDGRGGARRAAERRPRRCPRRGAGDAGKVAARETRSADGEDRVDPLSRGCDIPGVVRLRCDARALPRGVTRSSSTRRHTTGRTTATGSQTSAAGPRRGTRVKRGASTTSTGATGRAGRGTQVVAPAAAPCRAHPGDPRFRGRHGGTMSFTFTRGLGTGEVSRFERFLECVPGNPELDDHRRHVRARHIPAGGRRPSSSSPSSSRGSCGCCIRISSSASHSCVCAQSAGRTGWHETARHGGPGGLRTLHRGLAPRHDHSMRSCR